MGAAATGVGNSTGTYIRVLAESAVCRPRPAKVASDFGEAGWRESVRITLRLSCALFGFGPRLGAVLHRDLRSSVVQGISRSRAASSMARTGTDRGCGDAGNSWD